MKNLTKLTLVMVPVITFSFSAIAHDPSMHEKSQKKQAAVKWTTAKWI